MQDRKVKVGIIGCGNISGTYIESLQGLFDNTEVCAVSDIFYESAREKAEKYHIPHVCRTMEELLAMEEIGIVVVLVNPVHHYEVVKKCLLAGKHTYVEKPLALTGKEGRELLDIAGQKKRMLCAAPDSILGAGWQMARKLIEDGWIGEPIGAISHMLTGGPESWHPNPAFLYHVGAGPLYDVAVYWVAGLTYLFGPAGSVMCSAKRTYERREIGSEPLRGQMIEVEVPTYLTGILNMRSGVICSIHHSFDVDHTLLDNRVEIYGTGGTIVVPAPDMFDGEIDYRGKNDREWRKIPSAFAYKSNCRGIGAADMADALLTGRNPRLNGAFAYHTLEILNQLESSARENRAKEIESGFERTPIMPTEAVWGKEAEEGENI